MPPELRKAADRVRALPDTRTGTKEKTGFIFQSVGPLSTIQSIICLVSNQHFSRTNILSIFNYMPIAHFSISIFSFTKHKLSTVFHDQPNNLDKPTKYR
jgi:hypothetical protein